MRLLICGDRDWTDSKPIATLLDACPPGTVVIHGAARGADRIAGRLAAERGFKVEPYPADWDVFGKAAGVLRNTDMLRDGKPDEVHAFHNDLDNSKGTKDMVKKANAMGLPVVIHTTLVARP